MEDPDPGRYGEADETGLTAKVEEGSIKYVYISRRYLSVRANPPVVRRQKFTNLVEF